MQYMNDDSYDYVFKILIIGDSGTGKSSVILRYTDGMYSNQYISTIGVDFKIRTHVVENKVVKLQIWDTAGQERFRSITSSYYRCSHAIIVAFDLNNPDSFKNLDYWFKETEKFRALKILVGTKCDLPSVIDPAEIAEFAKRHNVRYMETSAKLELGVQEIFDHICSQLITVHSCDEKTDDRAKPIKLVIPKKYRCC